MKPKRPQLFLIEWVDSAQPIPAWRYLDDLPPLVVVKCRSVGWLVAEGRGVVLIAPNLGNVETGGNAQGSGFIRIPAASITRRYRLVESD